MKRRFESNSTWIAVVCVIGALLIGAWIGLYVSASACQRTTGSRLLRAATLTKLKEAKPNWRFVPCQLAKQPQWQSGADPLIHVPSLTDTTPSARLPRAGDATSTDHLDQQSQTPPFAPSRSRTTKPDRSRFQ